MSEQCERPFIRVPACWQDVTEYRATRESIGDEDKTSLGFALFNEDDGLMSGTARLHLFPLHAALALYRLDLGTHWNAIVLQVK
jgi:hypothetical protein